MPPTFGHRLDMRLQAQVNLTLPIPASGCQHDSDETVTLFMAAGRRNSRSVCCHCPGVLQRRNDINEVQVHTDVCTCIRMCTYAHTLKKDLYTYTCADLVDVAKAQPSANPGTVGISTASCPKQELTHSRADSLVHKRPQSRKSSVKISRQARCAPSR